MGTRLVLRIDFDTGKPLGHGKSNGARPADEIEIDCSSNSLNSSKFRWRSDVILAMI
jgi:hypothetical protein